jgi:hypothetical protein
MAAWVVLLWDCVVLLWDCTRTDNGNELRSKRPKFVWYTVYVYLCSIQLFSFNIMLFYTVYHLAILPGFHVSCWAFILVTGLSYWSSGFPIGHLAFLLVSKNLYRLQCMIGWRLFFVSFCNLPPKWWVSCLPVGFGLWCQSTEKIAPIVRIL